TYLYVGGGIDWANPSAVLRVQNSGFTKIAGTDTYDAFNTDSNGADVDYRVVQQGAAYESVPRIEGVTHAQTPASVATPVPSSLIDVAAAFTAYRAITTQLAACAETISLEDANGNPLGPITPGSQAYFDLEPGVTNVLELSAEDLDDLSVLTFRDPPTATTPLLINVTGSSFDGNFPNLAGVSGPQAPYILWNFPTATSVDVTEGGATVEGTMYVPNGTLTWRPSQNIEGNVIATNFNHGPNPPRATPRELHDFPFAAELSCADEPTPTPTPTGITPTPTPTASPTPTPTPSPSPTTTPTETPSPSPSDSVLPASETLPPTDTGTVSSSDLPGTGGPPAWALTAGFAALAGGLGLATWARLRRRTS
ncbi:MAG: collagen-binding domain-containing protein, partial [Marmoricola sp.]